MIAFLARRSALAVVTVTAVSMFSYVVIQMPAGDYVDRYSDLIFGERRTLNPPSAETVAEFKAAMCRDLGLDRPL